VHEHLMMSKRETGEQIKALELALLYAKAQSRPNGAQGKEVCPDSLVAGRI